VSAQATTSRHRLQRLGTGYNVSSQATTSRHRLQRLGTGYNGQHVSAQATTVNTDALLSVTVLESLSTFAMSSMSEGIRNTYCVPECTSQAL
ncbi:hypothetical protein LSAT2_032502, partial [Lamellibrachia satsuma]